MMPRPAGKDAAFGSRAGTERPGTRKAARAPNPWSFTSRFAPRRSRIEGGRIRRADLQDFLERGYAAFRIMKDPDRLMKAIAERETLFMHSLFDTGEDSVHG